ncbi:NAD-dependent epimerase/dehydratase family protein [Curtobacterium sp. UNCCL20]|uniref:NAD-dependent epimerase/dehydratase family protein n=1 Tax=Curtobacterium sp. UNCCL20 TaxID=1502773 RepID=UPI0020C8E018|nr:NAD-dependent epimerase/dehydratase family protein [Curtobacterium sp. UNCCL20]
MLVTGGTGKTGSAVARLLAERGDAEPVIASRSGGRAGGAPSGVRFDWNDEASTIQALEATRPDALYLIAPPRDPDPLSAMGPFIAAARERGVRRAVLLGAKPVASGDAGLGEVYPAVADAFEEWAVLRPSWFMQDFVTDHHLAAMVRAGVLQTASTDGRVTYIDAEDIAAVAAVALTSSTLDNGELVLTGPEALTPEAVATTIGGVLGRTIRVDHVTESALAEELAERLPAGLAAALAHADATSSGDRTTDTVERVTGRPPRTLARFVRDERAAFDR